MFARRRFPVFNESPYTGRLRKDCPWKNWLRINSPFCYDAYPVLFLARHNLRCTMKSSHSTSTTNAGNGPAHSQPFIRVHVACLITVSLHKPQEALFLQCHENALPRNVDAHTVVKTTVQLLPLAFSTPDSYCSWSRPTYLVYLP